METVYDPKAVERDIFSLWEESGTFVSTPANTPHERTFTIVIPPPNVTGALHLGHALNNVLQDILVRYHRMRGFNTLWQPGTDHAGIATQAVVEKRIREEEGLTRHELGREELVRRIWVWKDQYETRIINQLKKMGCSCDWERVRFTLDNGLARAVRLQFFRMFKDGLIFRGKRLVNWDTQLQTAVSDDEVYHETVKGHFWHFKYPVIDPKPGEPKHVIIATTRPETMLGDTAVAVHPDPEGFLNKQESQLRIELETASVKERTEIETKLKQIEEAKSPERLGRLVTLRNMTRDGRKLKLPLVDREIPLITDEWANPMLGSGCVKITPAHDPNDYDVALRQNPPLPMINVLTADGKVSPIIESDGTTNPNNDRYAGLVFNSEARAKVVENIEALKDSNGESLLHNIEDRDVEIGHSDRSKTPIEPYLSDQWFIRTGDLNEPQALACAASRIPERQESENEPQALACAASRTPDLSGGATLVTWTTYGTWLPGDERGYVSRTPRGDGSHPLYNMPGERYDADEPTVLSAAMNRMHGESLFLNQDHASEILRAIAETCERHVIEPLAFSIMRNHIHVLCQAQHLTPKLLQLFKGNASKILNTRFTLQSGQRWWTKSGSVRSIRAKTDLTATLEYVQNQEGALLTWLFDDSTSEVAKLFKSARAKARGSLGLALAHNTRASGLAQAAMDAVLDERIHVYPDRYAKSYLDWLGEKRDWCISRQLWWGHRIPVWHKRVHLTEKNWSDHLLSTGLDHILDETQPEMCAIVCHAGTGRIVNWKHELFPVVAETEGDYDIFVSCEEDRDMIQFEKDGFTRDEDVLDTWFSSALWPFSTLGWPEQTEHLKQYYPGSVLVTSRDIITNWVARMVMFGLYSMGDVPFDEVYITPKVLDGRGETMSKSKGNGVDPVGIIKIYGADALRYSIADMTTETQDIRMPVDYLCPHCEKLTEQIAVLKAEQQDRKSRGEKIIGHIQPADCKQAKCTHCGKEFATQWAGDELKTRLGVGQETSEKFEIGRNFANKMWNAARFAFMNLEGAPCRTLEVTSLPPEDRWILGRLSQTIRRYHELIHGYQYAASIKELREFFWDCLCDWYIELAKPRFAVDGNNGSDENHGDDESHRTAQQVLAFCIDQTLRLWHPTVPFITERLWQRLNEITPRRGLPGAVELKTDTDLVIAEFPPIDGYPSLENERLSHVFEEMQNVVRGIRDIRSECKVSPKQELTVTVVLPQTDRGAFEAYAHIVKRMANIESLTVDPSAKRPLNSGSVTIGALRVFVHDISDDEADRKRTQKSLDDLARQISGKQAKLSNEKFTANAKAEVVEAERQRLEELLTRQATLQEHLEELGD